MLRVHHIKTSVFVLLLILSAMRLPVAEAREFVILYTGGTHAMLYPCNCPFESDGGVGRRASFIKQFREENPNTLVLDSGGFFAGGLMDEYTQNSELDSARTAINLRAMEMMGYDAVNVESDEFNFGRGFLEENIGRTKIPFLSCNIKSRYLKPYIIKEIGGVKFGIVGVASLSARAKAGGLGFVEPQQALREALGQMKKKGADFVVLLSQLEEKQDARLAKELAGIDIIIDSRSNRKDDIFVKIGPTLIVKTSWQGRRIGKLALDIENNKIINHKAELVRLSDKVKDDPQITAILPLCFSDSNCKKGYLSGTCQNPGKGNAHCAFAPSAKVDLLIITTQECTFCDTQKVTDYLNKEFPGLATSYLYYGDPKANKLVSDFGIRGLPAYFLGKEVEGEKNFDNIRDSLIRKGNYYFLKPEFSGISYFLNRRKNRGRVDIFLSLYDAGATGILENSRDYQPALHFLASEQGGDFSAIKGKAEVEEYLRSVCIQKYYPKHYWDYLTCRAKNINSSWWEACAASLDLSRISNCARGKEGRMLLMENIALNKELEVMFGPLYLLDNQEIFGIEGAPSREEFGKLFKKQDKR